jgi:hypothetical protein
MTHDAPDAAVPREGSGTGRRTSILVLDDEPIVCKRLKPFFQKAGYEVGRSGAPTRPWPGCANGAST